MKLPSACCEQLALLPLASMAGNYGRHFFLTSRLFKEVLLPLSEKAMTVTCNKATQGTRNDSLLSNDLRDKTDDCIQTVDT